jgi:hypothetical protein
MQQVPSQQQAVVVAAAAAVGGFSSCSGSIHQACAGVRNRSFLQNAAKLLNNLKPSSHKASKAAGAQSSAAGSFMIVSNANH